MKIVVDFVRAEQHWNPDTEVQVNYLVFAFGGREHKIACTEEDIIKAVRAAKGSQHEQGSEESAADPFAAEPGLDAHAAALGRVEEESPLADHIRQQLKAAAAAEEDAEQSADAAAMELEREFGGDFSADDAPVRNPPLTFEAVEQPKPRPTENAEKLRKNLIEQGLIGRPRTKAKIVAEKQERMRQIAQRAPYSRIAADEAGNPLAGAAPEARSAPGPTAGQPTVVRKPQATVAVGDDDDDGVAQG